MRLVLADVDRRRLRQVASEIPGALAVPTDVSRISEVESLAVRAYRRFGAVHLLCNNAGVAEYGAVWEVPLARWRRILGVNLWGAIHGCLAFVPRMIAARADRGLAAMSRLGRNGAGGVRPRSRPGAPDAGRARHLPGGGRRTDAARGALGRVLRSHPSGNGARGPAPRRRHPRRPRSRAAGGQTAAIAGSVTVKRAPRVPAAAASMLPPWFSTMLLQTLSPTSRPRLIGCVDVNGLKSRCAMAGSSPAPLSAISSLTLAPSCQVRTWMVGSGERCTASTALPSRFRTRCVISGPRQRTSGTACRLRSRRTDSRSRCERSWTAESTAWLMSNGSGSTAAV